jgi:putative transposase
MEHASQWDVGTMCRVLHVSRSGYYAWKQRPESERTEDDLKLVRTMRALFDEHGRTIGSRSMMKHLRANGYGIGRCKTRRLMREDGLVSKRTPKMRAVTTTDSNHDHPIAENVLQRQFAQSEPNRAWVSDITYIRTQRGFVYLAIVMDLYSRRIIGWHVSDTMTQELTIRAVWMAWTRRGRPAGVIVHSDRGSQYAANAYRRLLTERCRCVQSMSRKGNCWDNAPAESFFATLKMEQFEGLEIKDLEAAKYHAWYFIEIMYNNKRLHSTLGYVAPCQFEGAYIRNQKAG